MEECLQHSRLAVVIYLVVKYRCSSEIMAFTMRIVGPYKLTKQTITRTDTDTCVLSICSGKVKSGMFFFIIKKNSTAIF